MGFILYLTSSLNIYGHTKGCIRIVATVSMRTSTPLLLCVHEKNQTIDRERYTSILPQNHSNVYIFIEKNIDPTCLVF